MTLETRSYRSTPACEVRQSDDGPSVLTGYGAMFDTLSQNLGGFVEVIDQRAFNDTLRNDRNILGAVNHNTDWLLGTTASDTLTVDVDGVGLRYVVDLDPSDPDAQRAIAKVRSGKLRGSSFTFATREDEWGTTEEGFPLRRLLSVELFELGPVAMPAYRATEGEVALRSLAAFIDEPYPAVASAAAENHLADLIARAGGTDTPTDGAADALPAPRSSRPRRIRTTR